MLHISQVLPLIEMQLKVLQPKEAIQFKTYKKDRGFILYCIAPSQFQIVENGFKNTSYIGDLDKIRKQAKKSLKREFPRSNQVWVDHYQDLESPFHINDHHSHQIPLF